MRAQYKIVFANKSFTDIKPSNIVQKLETKTEVFPSLTSPPSAGVGARHEEEESSRYWRRRAFSAAGSRAGRCWACRWVTRQADAELAAGSRARPTPNLPLGRAPRRSRSGTARPSSSPSRASSRSSSPRSPRRHHYGRRRPHPPRGPCCSRCGAELLRRPTPSGRALLPFQRGRPQATAHQ
jgi:hypothetical protein